MRLDLRGTARPFLEENTGESLCGLRFGKDFLNRNTKKTQRLQEKKSMDGTSTYKTLVWRKMLLKNEKASHGPEENTCETHTQLIARVFTELYQLNRRQKARLKNGQQL